MFLAGTLSSGTVRENRKDFPASMQGGKVWAKKAKRGDMVWERVGSCLVQQWKDKAVTILTTIDSPNDYGFVTESKNRQQMGQSQCKVS